MRSRTHSLTYGCIDTQNRLQALRGKGGDIFDHFLVEAKLKIGVMRWVNITQFGEANSSESK